MIDVSSKKDIKYGNFRYCPKCRSGSLALYTQVSQYIDRRSGQLQFKLWFNVDIEESTAKSLGYYKYKGLWENRVLEQDLETALAEAEQIGATTFRQNISLLEQTNLSVARESQRRWENMMESINNLQEPEAPDFVCGRYWNHKIYGPPGHTKIFLDGTTVFLSMEQEKLLRIYLSERVDYGKHITKIRSQFVQ